MSTDAVFSCAKNMEKSYAYKPSAVTKIYPFSPLRIADKQLTAHSHRQPLVADNHQGVADRAAVVGWCML